MAQVIQSDRLRQFRPLERRFEMPHYQVMPSEWLALTTGKEQFQIAIIGTELQAFFPLLGKVVDVSQLGVSFKGMAINRMTQNLWSDFEPFFKTDEGMNLEALADTMRTKCSMAKYQGGIWVLPPKLWLIENEVCG